MLSDRAVLRAAQGVSALTCASYSYVLLKVFMLNYLKIIENLKEEIYLRVLELLWLQIFVFLNISVYSGTEKSRFFFFFFLRN